MEDYTYIIAPKNETNLSILNGFVVLYPAIATDGRLKTVHNKTNEDILRDGYPLIFGGNQYYMAKILTSDYTPSLLDGVIEPEVYTLATLPYSTMWL